jgi:hypothetical protein
MALPATPLNIAASGIQTELGYFSSSLHPISMNDSLVRRLLNSTATNSSISFSGGQGRSAPPTLSAITSSTHNGAYTGTPEVGAYAVAFNSDTLETYLVGQQSNTNKNGNANGTDSLIIQLRGDGVNGLSNARRWNAKGPTAGIQSRAVSVVLGNQLHGGLRYMYILINLLNGTSDVARRAYVIAYTIPGMTYMWVKSMTTTGNSGDVVYPAKMALDSSDNIYVAGYKLTNGGNFNSWAAKLDWQGTALWQKGFGDASDTSTGKWCNFYGCAVDSSANFYATGWTSDVSGGNGYYYPLLTKWDTNGNLLWTRSMLNTASVNKSSRQSCAVTDSSGNVYMAGWCQNTGNYTAANITSFDSSGNLRWSVEINYATYSLTPSDLKIGPDGNLWVLTYTGGAIYNIALIATLQTSDGTTIGCKDVGDGTVDQQFTPTGLDFDNWGKVIIVGYGTRGNAGRFSQQCILIHRQPTVLDNSPVTGNTSLNMPDGVTKYLYINAGGYLSYGAVTGQFTVVGNGSSMVAFNNPLTVATAWLTSSYPDQQGLTNLTLFTNPT